MSGVAPLRHLGRSALVAVGINSVVGGGIFILPASVAALVGPASLGAYVIAGTVALGVGWSLAALAARFDISGGPYLYVHHAFGGFAGFQAGWLFCLARLTAMASLLNGFARYLGALLPGGSGIEARALLVSLCAVAVVGSNVAGIRQTSGIANLLAIVKVVPLVLLGLAGLAFVRPESFAPAPFEPLPFVRAVLLLVFAFSGFEILTVPAEESLRPRRDMPYALLATILTVCVLYLMVHAVALGTLPGLRTEAAPLASVAGIMIGPPGRYAMTAVAALSTAGCALASLVGGTRMLYAMSRAAQIPAWIGALSVGRRTPLTASLWMGGLAATLAVLGRYDTLAAVSAGSRLLVYLACCLAGLRPAPSVMEAGEASRPARTGGGPRAARAVSALTAVAIVALLPGLDRREVRAGLYGIGFGTLLYAVARLGREKVRDSQGEVA